MKKSLPYIYTLLFSYFSAILTESVLFFLSAFISPFAQGGGDLLPLAGIIILCALSLVLIFAANLRLIFELDSVKSTVIIEIALFALTYLLFWFLCDMAFNTIFGSI